MFHQFTYCLRVAPLAAALALPGPAQAQAQAQFAPDWNASVAVQGFAPALAVDGGRNSVLAATRNGLPITVHKLGPAGGLLWQRALTGAGTASKAFDVVTNAAGQIFVGGSAVDATGVSQTALVAKLDAGGNTLWRNIGTEAPAFVRELVLDTTGRIYALVQAGSSSAAELQLVQYSANGVRQWSRGFGASYAAGRDSLVLNSNNQPVVTGNNSAGQAMVAAFDTQGNPLISFNAGTSGLSLAAGRNGEVYAVGSTGAGFLAIKYGAAFNEVWRTALPGGGGALRAAVDAAGDLAMTGSFGVPGTGAFGLTVINFNWRTVKLSAAGATLWSVDHGVNHIAMGDPAALVLGTDGAVWVTGRSAEPITGTTDFRPSMTILRYTATGVLAGTHYVSASNGGADMEVARDGGIHVTGEPRLLTNDPAPVLHFATPVITPARPTTLTVTAPVLESSSATATLTVSSIAGVTVQLSSTNTVAARVPNSVVVPPGATSVTFPITTLAVRRDTTLTIKAIANGITLSTPITVLNR